MNMALKLSATERLKLINGKWVNVNLNITNGSRTIWVSADGRNIPVDKLEIPHLINILEKLHQKAQDNSLGRENRDAYLTEYCPTYLALKRRAHLLRLGFITLDRYGRPTSQALAWVDKQRELARNTVAKEKVVKQLDLLTGNANNSLNALAELVAEKLKTVKRKR